MNSEESFAYCFKWVLIAIIAAIFCGFSCCTAIEITKPTPPKVEAHWCDHTKCWAKSERSEQLLVPYEDSRWARAHKDDLLDRAVVTSKYIAGK